MEDRKRYSDEELEEFRAIINDKLSMAKRDYEKIMDELTNRNSNDVDDTSPTFHALEEGSSINSKEQLYGLASRTAKYIKGLEAALIRIEKKTYGICRETGKLIPKERLRAVPHATLCIEVKQNNRIH